VKYQGARPRAALRGAMTGTDVARDVAAAFACNVCHAAFKTRNTLFRHLRENSECAAAGGLNEVEKRRGPKEPEDAKVRACSTPQVKTRKDKPRQHKKLHIETRPDSYEEELCAKVAGMRAIFESCSGAAGLSPEVFASPPEHYRTRAEFDVWHHDDGPSYVMFNGKDRVLIEHYPMADVAISGFLMPTLLAELRKDELLRWRLFQVHFFTTLHGDSMVSLLYHTPFDRAGRRRREQRQREERAAEVLEEDVDEGPLTDEWEEAAVRLQAALKGASVIGHSRGKKRVVGRDWVEERLDVAGVTAPLRYRQIEGGFSQPNASVARHMLAWARTVARDGDAEVGAVGPARCDDLLELYCGNGNFAVGLAQCFRRVLATELVKGSVEAAILNAEANGARNVALARVSAEELAQALSGTRAFQRLAHIDLAEYDLQTVLVDPPRAGLGSEVSSFIARFQRIVYISCNPETARADMEVLGETHEIHRLAAFDQFPYTDHLEMGMLLVRREG